MLVLALDTATSRGSLALLAGDRLLAEYTLESSASYLNRLLAGIDHLLQATEKTIQDVNLIVVSSGPGNFTGLRLGLSTAKGLAFAIGCPVIAVNTLDALAANFPFAALPVCALIDAKKHEVYAAFYHCEATAGQLVGNYLLLSPAALAARITAPTLLTGPGLESYGSLLQELLGDRAVLSPPEFRHVRASVLARLGLQQFAAGLVPDLDKLTPFYLRPADAEMKKTPGSPEKQVIKEKQ
jgi:tRNA threonylcarbamoyladenosine biosynthesis protein TsaB